MSSGCAILFSPSLVSLESEVDFLARCLLSLLCECAEQYDGVVLTTIGYSILNVLVAPFQFVNRALQVISAFRSLMYPPIAETLNQVVPHLLGDWRKTVEKLLDVAFAARAFELDQPELGIDDMLSFRTLEINCDCLDRTGPSNPSSPVP